MTVEWDPFACDEAPLPDSAAGKGQSGRYTKGQLDKIAEGLFKHAVEERPWAEISDPSPDLDWYSPACGFEDWHHKAIQVQLSQGIAYITINRPNTRNELDAVVFAGLCDALFALHSRKDIRCVVFSGEGTFLCGGLQAGFSGSFVQTRQPHKVASHLARIKERAVQAGALADVDDVKGIGRLLMSKFWYTMNTLPQFSIAFANGDAEGDGLGFLACTDMTVAVASARFAFPEVRTGGLQCLVAPYVVSKLGPGFARYMMATGKVFSSDDLRERGLVSEMVEDVDAGHRKIAEICEVLTACGPRSVEACKQLVVGVGGQPITEGVMFFTAALLAMVTVSDESRDGMICVQARTKKPWEVVPIVPLFGTAG